MRKVFYCILIFFCIGIIFNIAPAESEHTQRGSSLVTNKSTMTTNLLVANNNVITQTFPGTERCSQVCPIMVEICKAQGGSPGTCWCDEKGDITVAYIVCGH